MSQWLASARLFLVPNRVKYLCSFLLRVTTAAVAFVRRHRKYWLLYKHE